MTSIKNPQPPPSGSPPPSHHASLLRLSIVGLVLAIALVFSLPAAAQLPGTLQGAVIDENKQPVAGAEMVLTDPESPKFKQSTTTSKKGRYRILIADATKPYTLNITKTGHQTVTLNGVKVTPRKNTRRDFTMRTSASVVAGTPTPVANQGSGAAGLFNRGVAAMNAGDPDTAESNFKKALEMNPELHHANAALARMYLKQNRFQDAVGPAELAAAANIDADAMHQVLYTSYTELGNKEKAKEALVKMQGANPEKANANLFNEAADLYNTGNLADAKPLLELVLSQDANHAKANYMMGLIYAGEQINDKAKMHLEKFIELAPNDPDAALAKEMLNYLN